MDEYIVKNSSLQSDSSALEISMKEEAKQENKEIRLNKRNWKFAVALLIVFTVGIGLAIGLPLRAKKNNDSDYSSRTEWPELVGMDSDEAVKWLEEHYPNLNVYVLEYGDVYTTDYDVTRVRIFTEPNTTKVKFPPKIGR